MDDETQKIISDQLKKLPSDVKEAIVSVDYKTKLQEITKRQRLLIDQAAKLEMETTLVMIGLEPLVDYISNLQREMGLTETRAKEVAVDVSDNIFKPIRESLRAMNEEVLAPESGASEPEEKVIRFTNTNETSLNRDQILNEIENPSIIEGGDRSMHLTSKPTVSTELEIRPDQELETLPGEKVKEVIRNTDIGENILQAKMTKPTVITQQLVEVKSEIKLPEVKKRPTSGIDPYREPII